MSHLKRFRGEEPDKMICEWICKVIAGEDPQATPVLKPDVDLIEQLKDGIVLCKLINKLKPGSIPRINQGKLPFHKMENIGKYIEACKAQIGLGSDKIFTTPALFEEKDLSLVRLNLYSLGMHVKTMKGYTGPIMEQIKPPQQINLAETKDIGTNGQDQSTESKPEVTGNAVADTMDLGLKEALKFNPELEQCALDWIQAVLGEKLPKPSLEGLKDGVMLCKMLNKVKPGTIKRVNTEKLNKFKCMENLVFYIQGCISIGLPQDHLFDPADLFDEKNLNLVLTNIQTIGTVFAPKFAKDVPVMRTPSSTQSFYSSLLSPDILTEDEESLAKVLTSWINGHLSKISQEITSLGTDLTDGVKIIKLLELLTRQSVGSYQRDPYLPWHKMQNAVTILRFVGEQAANAVRDCTKTDLMLGKLKPLITFLNYIREKFDNDFKFKEVASNVRTKKIAEEIRDTEDTYVTMLSKVQDSIITPLHKALEADKEILTKEEISKVFCNLTDILALHQTLFKDLNARVSNYSTQSTKLSDIWSSRKTEILRLYTPYVQNFETVNSQLKYLKKKKKEFKVLIKDFENEQKKTNALDLSSFLILPVQRIPRYMLLITELEKYQEANHPDSKGLSQALEDVKSILTILDDSKATSNQRIVVIERMLDNMDFQLQLVHPEREFVREGPVRLVDDDEGDHSSEEQGAWYSFLFNDILIVTVKRGSSSGGGGDMRKDYEVKQIVPFSFCEGAEIGGNEEEDGGTFYLRMDDDRMKLACMGSENRESWVRDIQQQIDKKLQIDFE